MNKKKTAEQQKFEEFYSPEDFYGEEDLEDIEDCYYDFADECINPDLKHIGCCFECWLYQEAEDY